MVKMEATCDSLPCRIPDHQHQWLTWEKHQVLKKYLNMDPNSNWKAHDVWMIGSAWWKRKLWLCSFGIRRREKQRRPQPGTHKHVPYIVLQCLSPNKPRANAQCQSTPLGSDSVPAVPIQEALPPQLSQDREPDTAWWLSKDTEGPKQGPCTFGTLTTGYQSREEMTQAP